RQPHHGTPTRPARPGSSPGHPVDHHALKETVMSMIFTPDSLRTQVEAATGGHITVLYDDKGYPSYMRVVPKFRYEDLGMETLLGTGVATAFLKNGQEKSEIFVGQYPATLFDGRACSLPGKDPRTSINF